LGKYNVKRLSLGRVVYDIIRVVATVGLVVLGTGVAGVMIGWLISEAVAVLIYFAAAITDLQISTEKIELIPILTFALPNLAFQTIDVTIQNTDRIILLQVTDFATLGVYDVFLRVLFMFSFFSLTVASSLYPILTRLRMKAENAKNTDQKLGEIIVHLVRYILIILIPVAVIAALNSHIILSLLFGASYANFPDASASFALLVLSYALWGVVYALHTVLRSMGESRFFVVSGLLIILFEIVGAWYLTALLGILGSALIRAAYISLLFLAAAVRLYQLGVKGLSKATPSVVRITVSSMIGGIITMMASPSTLVGLVLWVLLGGTLYLVILLATREIIRLDFAVLLAVLPTRFHASISKLRDLYFGTRPKWK
jgi:O-antigen/teichoic acid export membrane protein